MNKHLKVIYNNKNGFSLVEMLITASIMGFIALSGLHFSLSSSSSTLHQVKMIELRRALVSYMTFQRSWSYTINNEDNKIKWCRDNFKKCVQNGKVPDFPLDLQDFKNNSFSKNLSDGYSYFTPDNQACDYTPEETQSSGPGSKSIVTQKEREQDLKTYLSQNNCKIKVKATWKPICDEKLLCTQMAIAIDFYYEDKLLPSLKIDFISNYYFGNATAKEESIDIAEGNKLEEINAKVKVVFIIDNSKSMTDNLAKLESSLLSYIDKLKEYDFDIYFYTMYALDEMESLADDKKSLRYIRTLELASYMEDNQKRLVTAISNPSSTYTGIYNEYFKKQIDSVQFEVESQPEKLTSLNGATEFENSPIYSKDRSFIIKKDISRLNGINFNTLALSKNEQKAAISKIFSEIKNMPTFPNQTGICMAGRILDDTGPNSIIEAGDRVVFAVLSDGDDDTFTIQKPWETISDNQLVWTPSTMYSPCIQKIRRYYYKKKSDYLCNPVTSECTEKQVHLAAHLKINGVYNHEMKYTVALNGEEKSFTTLKAEVDLNYPKSRSSGHSELIYIPGEYSNCNADAIEAVKKAHAGWSITNCSVKPIAEERRYEGIDHGYTSVDLDRSKYRVFGDYLRLKNSIYGTNGTPMQYYLELRQSATCDSPLILADGSITTINEIAKKSESLNKLLADVPGSSIDDTKCEIGGHSKQYALDKEVEADLRIDIKQVANENWFIDMKRGWQLGDMTKPNAANEYGGREVFKKNLKLLSERRLGKGFDNFISIIHLSDDLCDTDSTGGVGFRYIERTKTSDTPQEIHNICSNSFELAVSNLVNQAISLARSTYKIELKPREFISSIRIIRDNEPVTLSRTQYRIAPDGSVTFSEGTLTKGDELVVGIERY